MRRAEHSTAKEQLVQSVEPRWGWDEFGEQQINSLGCWKEVVRDEGLKEEVSRLWRLFVEDSELVY